MATEIELKLSIEPAALPELRRHPALAAVLAGRPRTTMLHSTYYDTPTLELHEAGLALRLRRAGGRWRQTIKSEGSVSGGLHQRGEYEWPVNAPSIDTAKLATTPWRKQIAACNGRFRPVFVTEVKRTAQPIAFRDGTRATLCVDVGEIRAGRKRAAVMEIELELQRGNPVRLFELASALAAECPVRVNHTSKAERGYALATAEESGPRRAQTVPLDTKLTLDSALAAIGGDCVAQIGINAEGLLASDDPEFLHQLRVGWRRLRSLLRLTATLVTPDMLALLEQELERLGAALGPARDWDVFATETLPAIAAHFRGRSELPRLRARITRRRRQLREVARAAAAAPAFQRLLLETGALFASLARNQASAQAAPVLARDWALQLLRERDRKLRRRARRIHRASPEERHRARVAAKKLRYAAEFFAPLFSGKRAGDYIGSLSKLQAALGRLNDLASAERIVGELSAQADARPGSAHALGLVHGWVAARGAPELKRLRDAQRTFSQCEPFWKP